MAERRPHICFVAPYAYPILAEDESVEFAGGAELQQVLVARGLAKRGYPVSMICLDFGQQDQIEIHGIRVFRAYKPGAGIPILRFLWPRLTGIWDCLSRAQADIYYQRTAGMLTGVVAAFCKRAGKKSVFAAAGNPDLEPDTPRIRYWRDRRIYEYGLRNIDRILVQNDEQAQLCRKVLGRDPVHIPNLFPAPSVVMPGSRSCVLWVSMIRKIKRPEVFLDLAESLPQYRFRMIGGAARGEELRFASIRARAESIVNVEFLGFVPYHGIAKHFADAALFANTSESEGFPNTFLQAWSHGIPTVSFVDAGARVNNETVGRIVGSLSEMTEVVLELLLDKGIREKEGLKAKTYFEQNHSTERVLDLYEKVIDEI